MTMIPRIIAGITAHNSTPWIATIFEQATDEEYEAWAETEATTAWFASMTSKAKWSRHTWDNKDQSDFQLGDRGSMQDIKSYICFYGHPPPPAYRPRTKECSDMAWVKPTTEHVRALNLGEAGVSMKFDIEVDEKTNRCRLLPSADTINTDARFAAPGVLLMRTGKGWLLYEGDLEYGMSVDQTTAKGDPIRNYKGLSERLTGRSARTAHDDVLEWGPNSSMKVYMPLIYTDREGVEISSEAVSVRLGGPSVSTLGRRGGILTPEARLMSLQSTLEEFARDGIYFMSTDADAAAIPSESITCLCGNYCALKLCRDTEVTVVMYQRGEESKKEVYYRDRKGVKDVDLTCRMICLIPEMPDLDLGNQG